MVVTSLLIAVLRAYSNPQGQHTFLVNLICGLIAYCHQEKKPSITLPAEDLALLTDGSEDMMIFV
jgi:hypothetical protein